jgi:hypothetical protein
MTGFLPLTPNNTDSTEDYQRQAQDNQLLSNARQHVSVKCVKMEHISKNSWVTGPLERSLSRENNDPVDSEILNQQYQNPGRVD